MPRATREPSPARDEIGARRTSRRERTSDEHRPRPTIDLDGNEKIGEPRVVTEHRLAPAPSARDAAMVVLLAIVLPPMLELHREQWLRGRVHGIPLDLVAQRGGDAQGFERMRDNGHQQRVHVRQSRRQRKQRMAFHPGLARQRAISSGSRHSPTTPARPASMSVIRPRRSRTGRASPLSRSGSCARACHH